MSPTIASTVATLEQRINQLAPTVVNDLDRGYISDLRAAVGGSKADFDRAFGNALESGKIVAYQADAPIERKGAIEAGKWTTPSGSERHIFYINRR